MQDICANFINGRWISVYNRPCNDYRDCKTLDGRYYCDIAIYTCTCDTSMWYSTTEGICESCMFGFLIILYTIIKFTLLLLYHLCNNMWVYYSLVIFSGYTYSLTTQCKPSLYGYINWSYILNLLSDLYKDCSMTLSCGMNSNTTCDGSMCMCSPGYTELDGSCQYGLWLITLLPRVHVKYKF